MKGEYFKTVSALSVEKLLDFAQILNRIDDTFDATTLLDSSKPVIIGKKLFDFMKTHCRERNYMFSVKKCGMTGCICGIVRTEKDVFSQIHHLPDPSPIMSEPDKFKHFDECYGKYVEQEPDKYLQSKN